MNQMASLPSRFYPLQWKLLIPLLIIGIVSVFSLNVLFNYISLKQLTQFELQRAHQLVNTINHVTEIAKTPEQLRRFISVLGAERDISLIIIIANNHHTVTNHRTKPAKTVDYTTANQSTLAKVVACTRYVWIEKSLIELPQDSLGEELYQALQNQQSYYSYHPESNEFHFSAPLLLSEDLKLTNNLYQSVVTIHFNTVPIQTILHPVNWLIRAWTLGLLTVIFIFIYIWLNHLIRRPLQGLHESIQKRMAGDKTITMPIQAHDEIGTTAHIINVLLEQQEQDQTEIKKLALVAQHTNSAVVITDSKTRVEWVNDGFTQITGYTFAEVIGKRPGVFLHGPETNPTTLAEIRTAIRNQQPIQTELVNYTKDGQPYWIALNIQPICDEQGKLSQFISVEIDITPQKQAEQKLQQQAQIIHQIHDAVITMDTHYLIRYWNQGAERLYGYTAEEVMGQPFSLLSLREDRDKLQRASMEALLKIGNNEVEVRLLKKSKEVFFAHCSFSLLRDSEDKVIGLISFTIDLTERQHLETVLKAEHAILTRPVEERVADLSTTHTQLKKANQLKEEFLANMSHELRIPLNAILGMSEILTEPVSGELNEKQLRAVPNIRTVESQKGQGSHFMVILPDVDQTKTSVVEEEEVNTKEPLDKTSTFVEIAPLILLAEDNPNNVEVIVNYLGAFGYRLKVASTGIEVLTRLTEKRNDGR